MENNQKKGKFALSRKQFIIGLIALCLVAVIAEVVLLVHGFKKKPDEKPAEVTPTQLALLTVSPTPTTAPTKEPTPTPEVDHYESVWKLAKEYKTGQYGQKNPLTVREYDEQGRESKRLIYDEDSGDLKMTAVFRYDRSGIVLVDYWVPSVEDGELKETKCFHPLADREGGHGSLNWLYYSATVSLVDYGEKVIGAEYDEDGNLTFLLTEYHSVYMNDGGEYTVEWKIDSEGVLQECAVLTAGGSLKRTINVVHNDDGKSVDFVEYLDNAGAYFPWGITYGDEYTFYTEPGNGIFTFAVKDGLPVIYARYMGNMYHGWPGVEAVTDLNRVVPELERGIIYRPKGNFSDFFPDEYMFDAYDPESLCCMEYTVCGEDYSPDKLYTVEARPDGQPVLGDDFYNQKHYEYDEKGRLTRYSSSQGVDILTELDDNWNLVKKTDQLTNEVYEYEWILVDVAVYK